MKFWKKNSRIQTNENNIPNIYFDQFETNIYNDIKQKFLDSGCGKLMWRNQREFLNGVVRKFRPKKLLEIGVRFGGSSILILNAIRDIQDAHLYSIDIDGNGDIGKCVHNHFPELRKKWTLYKGSVAANYMEEIGNEIDLAFIDTAHFEPGEILDLLQILPFLKDGAVVLFHDISHQISHSGEKGTRQEWAPYIIFNILRGQKFYPSGNRFFAHDIGAVLLEKNQKRYVHDYFRALGGQWSYYPKSEHIELIRQLFRKYYDDLCLKMFEEIISFEKDFVENNPIPNYYMDAYPRIKPRLKRTVYNDTWI